MSNSVLEIDLEIAKTNIIQFIRNYIEHCDAEGVVIGLSGGLDSSTTIALATLALGKTHVLGVMMPERKAYSLKELRYARIIANKFGFNLQKIDISDIIEAYYSSIPVYTSADKLSNGNVKARCRMVCLYYYANKLRRLVCGTSDKSEFMMGYFTKWGDGAADISPIRHLYKTQVRQLALYIGVPEEIVLRPSTPGFWENQLAEEELGIKYEVLDPVLFGLEHRMKSEEIARQLSLPLDQIVNIRQRWLANGHKRHMSWTVESGS